MTTSWSAITIAGTGHRPPKLGGYGSAAVRRVYEVAHAWLALHRPGRVISGMALGWDQALALAALNLDLAVTAAVPFEGQASRWPSASRTAYEGILRRIAKSPHGSVAVLATGPYTPDLMQARNRWMVDNSQAVLALWNGTPGGTGNCLAYAERIGRPIVNLWSTYQP